MPFSILGSQSNNDSIVVDVDPTEKLAERSIQPQVDPNLSEVRSGGFLVLQLDHPECKQVRIPFAVLPEYEFTPRSLRLMNMDPNHPLRQSDRFGLLSVQEALERLGGIWPCGLKWEPVAKLR